MTEHRPQLLIRASLEATAFQDGYPCQGRTELYNCDGARPDLLLESSCVGQSNLALVDRNGLPEAGLIASQQNDGKRKSSFSRSGV